MSGAEAQFTVTYEMRLPDSWELEEDLYDHAGPGDRGPIVERLRARGFVPVWRAIHLGQPPVAVSMASVDGVTWVPSGSDLDAAAHEEIDVVLDGLCEELSTEDVPVFRDKVSERVLRITQDVYEAVT